MISHKLLHPIHKRLKACSVKAPLRATKHISHVKPTHPIAPGVQKRSTGSCESFCVLAQTHAHVLRGAAAVIYA